MDVNDTRSVDGGIIATTTLGIEGYRIVQYRGIVRGLVVRTPTISQGFMAFFQNIRGGQIAAYREMCEQAREQAYLQMVEHARVRRANAVVGIRYDASESAGATEVLCYGTAVVVEKA